MLQPGHLFDNRYLLKAIIGEGGMSQVWLAEDSFLQSDYALKIFLSHLNDNMAKETLKQEFKILKGLNHDNIVHHEHFGIDRDSGLPYIVTTYYEKGSAVSIINKSGAALDEMVIARFMHDAAHALEYLGSQNPPIVHQDIKPDNFLVDRDGSYVLSDFGISIRKRQTQIMHPEKESGGNWAGDQAYLAPERFKGSVPRQSQDVFSLGVALFEIATGVLPFGELGGVLMNSGAGRPEMDPAFGYSRQLESIIQSCLSADPDERPSPTDLIEKSGFYLKNEFWPVAKEKKPSTWPLIMGRIRDMQSGLATKVGASLRSVYGLRRPILGIAAGVVLILMIFRNYDRITGFISSLNTDRSQGTQNQPPVAVQADTVSIASNPFVISEPSVDSAITVRAGDPKREDVKTSFPGQKTTVVQSTAEEGGEEESVVATTNPPPVTRIQSQVEDVVQRQPESKPVVIAQTETRPAPEPVSNVEKPAAKPVRENSPPVIDFRQSKYTVFNTQRELLISADARDVDGSIASYQWTQGVNPSRVEFDDESSSSTKVININRLRPGTYRLTLIATDNQGLKTSKDVELVIRKIR